MIYIDSDLTTIVSGITSFLSSIKSGGFTIVKVAISLGGIFISARWLWKKACYWLMILDYKRGKWKV